MFHLIDKIYLAPDFMIDMHRDRVVVSDENGYNMYEPLLNVSGGILYKSGGTVEEVFGEDVIAFFKEILEFSKSRERSLYIYADEQALPKIQAIWFKLMLEHVDYETCYRIYNANVHKFNMLHKSTLYSNSGPVHKTVTINAELLNAELNNTTDPDVEARRSFCEQNKDGLGVEYLLANYLYNGKLKVQLKESLKRIMRKHFDSILLEYKSLFLGHYTNPQFAQRINLEKRYSFENLDIFSDNSAIAEFFLSERLYKTLEVTKYSSNSNFQFDKMTDDDIMTLRMYADALGSYYSFNNTVVDFDDGLSPILRDGYKWQFLDCVRGEFTDELLDNMINLEADINYSNGSFYNFLLETVNGYTVQYILQLHKNNELEKLKNFIVMD
jgi:hypothetical protein